MDANPIQPVTVKVDPATLAQSSSGSITGLIVVQSGEASFPDPHWDDFPITILAWWLEPVPRILKGKTRSWECLFMDGPCSLQLEQEHDDAWKLTGLRNSNVQLTATVSCREFIHSVLQAARLILHECHQRNWQSRDIDTLASAVRTVERDRF